MAKFDQRILFYASREGLDALVEKARKAEVVPGRKRFNLHDNNKISTEDGVKAAVDKIRRVAATSFRYTHVLMPEDPANDDAYEALKAALERLRKEWDREENIKTLFVPTIQRI
uniref:Uncharacterized protein n=1 Tax=candidate division WWE3 bacterium TaxID=2053526 RepID=A0A7C4TJ27_UNCKA